MATEARPDQGQEPKPGPEVVDAHSLRQLLGHPGWALYSRVLESKRVELEREVRDAVRGGRFGEAALKQAIVDTIADCLDVPRNEAADLELTVRRRERETIDVVERELRRQPG